MIAFQNNGFIQALRLFLSASESVLFLMRKREGGARNGRKIMCVNRLDVADTNSANYSPQVGFASLSAFIYSASPSGLPLLVIDFCQSLLLTY